MIKKNILYFGRFDDKKSTKLYKLLKKKFQNVKVCWSKSKKQKIPKNIFSYKNDCIISYRSYFILNKRILSNTRYAVNFHPGPPDFRGMGCANFAIYQNVKKYGATCHLINNKIDNGKIVKAKLFNIKKNISLEKLLKKTHSEMFILAKSIINKVHDKKFLLDNIKKSNRYNWSKKYYNQSDLENLYKLSIDFSKDEINKVLRATIYKKFYPYLLFGKHKIGLKKNYEKL
jgi:methionyl-tRNA formyltransferase